MKEKILVLSDIHGNKEALNRIDKYIRKVKVDKIICLGDTVGYGVDFNWCLNWLEKNNAVIIKGNHESMLLGETNMDKCSKIAKESTIWTMTNVKKYTINKIMRINDNYIYKEMMFTHAGDIKLRWPYINNIYDCKIAFINPKKINFFGHTHRAMIISENEVIKMNKSCNIYIDREKQYYINPGSIGQNRGKKTGVSFIILEINDSKEYIVRYYFFKYNAYKAYKSIMASSMSEYIANYLIRETWKKRLFKILYKTEKYLQGGVYGE